MPNSKKCIRAITVISSVALAACGGGGRGYMASAIPSPATGNTSGNSSATGGGSSTATITDIVNPSGYDSGFTGSAPMIAPASFGTSPAPAQIATADGATFPILFGHGFATWPYPSNTTFPIMFTGVQQQSNGLAAIATGQSGTVTVTVDGEGAIYHVLIPSLNVDVTTSCCDEYGLFGAFVGKYVDLGWWGRTSKGYIVAQEGNGSSFSSSEGQYLYGYETPASAMPTTGQANFSGWALVNVYAPVDGHILESAFGNGWIQGTASLSVDFSSSKITGAFTKMVIGTKTNPAVLLPWNDVSVNASIAAGTNKFSGITAVTSAPQNTFSLKASATGSIGGAFYGPAADELGAIWTLSDGTLSAVGGLAARRLP